MVPDAVCTSCDSLLDIYLYKRSSAVDGDGCLLQNNSAALGGNDLNSRYGIACHRPDPTHNVTWYFPDGNRVNTDFSSNRIFSGELRSSGDQELRRSSNFQAQFEGVYMCTITDGNGTSQNLYIGVYHMIQPNFTMVNFGIYPAFEGSEGGVLVLNCSSSALPVLRASWYFNDQLITVGERTQYIFNGRSTTYNSLLVIRRDELSVDMRLGPGQYRCLLESAMSSITQSLNLSKFTQHWSNFVDFLLSPHVPLYYSLHFFGSY